MRALEQNLRAGAWLRRVVSPSGVLSNWAWIKIQWVGAWRRQVAR